MAPQWFEVDVWCGTRKLDDLTMRVVIDWRPDRAEQGERTLNRIVEQAAAENRARASDQPGASPLYAYPVDDRGERTSRLAWLGRWTGPQEVDRR